MKPRLRHIAFLLAGVLVVALQAPSSAFGATSEEKPAISVRSGVDLKLVGTAVAAQSEKSLAVVEIGDRLQVYLREGDMIGNVLIKRILYDQVIVDDGKGEKKIKLRQSLSDGVIIQTEAGRPPVSVQSFGPRPPEDRNFQAVFLDREAAKDVFADIDGALKDAQINSVSVYGRPASEFFRLCPAAYSTKSALSPGMSCGRSTGSQ